ncbi:GYF domain-containing protein [Luteolibacter flavescens]|uniref:GYF domain-containing protein n=1 Tax=Luteolibacter flavescens TaxID=1859460 RepID=A0ABT3FK02_9BACT|nr:GYF domain-containing protein [Luteolibacter flavescens]MCW1883901.1 GYF domain-containing protein [Luteolibacter flavescens]
MSAWYYAKDGQQHGPVSTDEIVRLFGTGSISPGDLVWREGMVDWKPAGEVPELAPAHPAHEETPASLTPAAAVSGSAPDAFNPYRPPTASWNEPQSTLPEAGEIVPGSQPLDIGFCISRAWDLTKRHFGMLIAVGLIYGALSAGFGVLTELPIILQEAGTSDHQIYTPSAAMKGYIFVANCVSHIFDIFLGLGLTRIGLNLVSEKPAEIGMLFGEGRKLVTGVLAAILYYSMVALGLILLIFPGIYLALRFGQYQAAIVDKDLGVMDSLKYSARITQGNLLSLFGLAIVSMLIVLAGVLALLVGLFAALPIVYLASYVSYRWLQYGRASIPGHR